MKPAKIFDLREECRGKRVIAIGDPHGCLDEFIELLHLFKWDNDRGDVLVVTGDLLDRGPKIKDLVKFVRTFRRVHTVEGNHENKIKRHYRGNPVHLGHAQQMTLDALKEEDQILPWLENLPHIIRIRDDMYVVHAGIDPGRPMTAQAENTCLRVRSLEPAWVREGEEYDPPMWYEKMYPESPKILFGHSVLPDPVVHTNARALDGGCVFGGELRGIEILGDEFGRVLTVKAKKEYYSKRRIEKDEC